MPTHTIIRGPADKGALRPGDKYEFAEGDQHFVGEVRKVVPVSATKNEITVEMTAAEHERMLAAQP
jgi:hypothetical protein